MSMVKIAFIGAGSTVFARNLLRDIFTFPELHDSTIALMDIDPVRLVDTEAVAGLLAKSAGANPTITATSDLRQALDGADYAINMIQVGGYRPSTVIDFDIPKKYGLRQTIGDTLGIGGIMRALRTIPVMLDMGRAMEDVCPDVLFLNYTNPMAMLCMAMNRATSVRTVGLCHSVQGTAEDLAGWIGIPYEEVNYICAGVNHVAFYLAFEHEGQDLYPALRELADSRGEPAWERVRFEVFRRFGYFVTESSEHFSEYVPWFIKPGRDDLIQQYNIPLDEYPARCENQIAEWTDYRAALTSPESDALARYEEQRRGTLSGMTQRRLAMVEKDDPALANTLRQRFLSHRAEEEVNAHSGEYGTLIIHSDVTGQPRVVYGNVQNNSLIANLPPRCCVEVPCLVDRNGLQPTEIGVIPTQLAALMQTNINVQELTVEGALTGNRDRIYQAAMLDPHTAAELGPDQIVNLVDDLLAAHGKMIPNLR